MRVTIDQALEAIGHLRCISDAVIEPMPEAERTMLAVSIRHAARVIEAALAGDRVANPHDTDDTSPLGGMVSWILDVSEMLNLPPPDMAAKRSESPRTLHSDSCSVELYARTADERDKAVAACRAAARELRRLATRSHYQPPEVHPSLWATVEAIAGALDPLDQGVVLRASTNDDDGVIPF